MNRSNEQTPNLFQASLNHLPTPSDGNSTTPMFLSCCNNDTDPIKYTACLAGVPVEEEVEMLAPSGPAKRTCTDIESDSNLTRCAEIITSTVGGNMRKAAIVTGKKRNPPSELALERRRQRNRKTAELSRQRKRGEREELLEERRSLRAVLDEKKQLAADMRLRVIFKMKAENDTEDISPSPVDPLAEDLNVKDVDTFFGRDIASEFKGL